MDATFEAFLNDGFFDNPAPPPEEHVDILTTPMWGAVESDLQMGDVLMCEDMLLAPDGPDLIEGAADATIDLSLLCEKEPKREPRCSPSPDGSDSGVDAYSAGFEYGDTPPVTPPQVVVPATPAPPHATTIIQLIKQEPMPSSPMSHRRPSVDVQPQTICVRPAVQALPQKLPIPALPRTHARKPARGSRVATTAASAASPATTYIISGAAAVKPAAAIRPRPVAVQFCSAQVDPSSQQATRGRRLSTRVIVPPTREQMDPRALKRQERMIKNRMAACLSRKKRKDQFTELETRTKQLEAENSRLREQNQLLHRQLAQLVAEVDMLRQSEAPSSPPPSPRKPLMLFSVLLLAALNFAPLGWSPVPPLDAGPPLGGGGGGVSRGGRTLLWAGSSDDEVGLHYLAEALNASSGHMCPKHVNQTEARRLSRVLHGWFDSAPAPRENASLSSDAARRAVRDPGGGPQPIRRRPRPRRKRTGGRSAGLQLYRSEAHHGPYQRLLDAIRRRDDTFYVVSFNGDHLMLPALAHNQTQRPRMSLLLPSLPLNESMRAPEHFLAMMQIDCEVINTKLLHIHESAVPVPPAGTPANATNGEAAHFRFPSSPLGGFPTDSSLRLNGSGLGKMRRGIRKPSFKKYFEKRLNGKLSASQGSANVTSGLWSKLRFDNYSLEGSSDDTAFEASHIGRKEARIGTKKLLRRRRPSSNVTASKPPSNSDYFQSEH